MLADEQKSSFRNFEREIVLTKLKAQNSKRKIRVLFILLLIQFLLFGCASLSDFESLRNDVNMLRRETFEIKKDVNDLKTKTEGAIKEQDFKAFRESQAEIHSRVSDLSKELQFISGKFDESKYSMEKLQKESVSEMNLLKAELTNIAGQVKEIKERLNRLESRSKEAEKKLEESKKESQQEPSVSKDKISMYETAYEAFKNKRYKEAREKFDAFIKEYPQDELTDNAYFWIAETYYGEKDFEGAILAYEVILKKFPKSEKAPNALLKQGLSFIEIGDRKTGKTIFEKVIEDYPSSKEAELAKKKIEEIDKKTEKKKK